MANNIDPWELLREARKSVLHDGDFIHDLCADNSCPEHKRLDELLARIDAALAAREVGSLVKCEFCKGVGIVPHKKPWSPRSVLGNENE